MRFRTMNIDSLLGRARRAQYRFESQAAGLSGLLELALDAESSGRPSPLIRRLQAIVEAGEKLFGRAGPSLKRQSPLSRRKGRPRKKMLAKRRKRTKPARRVYWSAYPSGQC